jgi:DNA-binding NarL/FixJ family response regulator
VAGEPSEAADEAAWASRLSSRELEVAFLVARGLSNKEVARKLNVTDGTIKVHMHRIFKKLGTKSRGLFCSNSPCAWGG